MCGSLCIEGVDDEFICLCKKKVCILYNNDLNTKLTVLSPDKTSIDYKGANTNKNGDMSNINLPQKGSYNYILTFSHNVGVTQNKRGSFNLN